MTVVRWLAAGFLFAVGMAWGIDCYDRAVRLWRNR